MNVTDKLRLELFLREQIQKHGEDFYTELAKLLERLQNEEMVNDLRGKPNLVSLRRRG